VDLNGYDKRRIFFCGNDKRRIFFVAMVKEGFFCGNDKRRIFLWL
jgi:hypothetical protein